MNGYDSKSESKSTEFQNIVDTITAGSKEFALKYNVDALLLAQALLKVGLAQVFKHNSQPEVQVNILTGLVTEINLCLQAMDHVSQLNSGTSQMKN